AAIGLVILPANTDPVEAPATLIWQFRLATVAGAAAYWSVVGMVFGWLRVDHRPDVVVARVDVHDHA
ncbi:MAG TPA: CbtA family protein, partial [Acidimicrobiales bacterium]|nr:CbtA family protein [Acidimicrobiales bacterium]